MKSTSLQRTVCYILRLKKAKLLAVDPEYQRGRVWTLVQKQFFVDSILRGYHIPLIYLHVKKSEPIGDFQVGDRLYIVDGQQRVQALYEFSEGAFPLLDPKRHVGRFPKSLVDAPCPWAGKDIRQLDDETRIRFHKTKLSVVEIETSDENEVRDLFIRLQGGKPLTPQEQRDAWPGKFGEFVCRVGGKEGIARYPGHEFFQRLMRGTVRAKKPNGRQLAAQLVMLFDKHRQDKGFCDIKRKAVDEYYINHMDFDSNALLAKKFWAALDKITELLGDGSRPLFFGHQAIHLVLLVGTLLDATYVPESWQPGFAQAFDRFTERLNRARVNERGKKMESEDRQYMDRYGYKTRTSSDMAHTIRDRHLFFSEKMLERIQPRRRDSKRVLGPLEREIVYGRDRKKCGVCGKDVVWSDAEFHHVIPYSEGGPTTIGNAALVHRACHPRTDEAVQQFAKRHRDEVA